MFELLQVHHFMIYPGLVVQENGPVGIVQVNSLTQYNGYPVLLHEISSQAGDTGILFDPKG